jgi:serine O-acetyltransferase
MLIAFAFALLVYVSHTLVWCQTGIVIGETATVGHNCSILHHVTLGGSGRRGNDRHPKIGDGVLLGAGASVLGNVRVGDGCQVGAGTLVIGKLYSAHASIIV